MRLAPHEAYVTHFGYFRLSLREHSLLTSQTYNPTRCLSTVSACRTGASSLYSTRPRHTDSTMSTSCVADRRPVTPALRDERVLSM